MVVDERMSMRVAGALLLVAACEGSSSGAAAGSSGPSSLGFGSSTPSAASAQPATSSSAAPSSTAAPSTLELCLADDGGKPAAVSLRSRAMAAQCVALAGAEPEAQQTFFRKAQQACAAGDAQACESQARCLTLGCGVPASAEAGLALLRPRCASGEAQACETLGELQASWSVDPAARAAAEGPLQQACTAGRDAACVKLARLLADAPQANEAQLKRAAELAKQACDRQSLAGCVLLGNLHEVGDGVALDTAASVALYTRA